MEDLLLPGRTKSLRHASRAASTGGRRTRRILCRPVYFAIPDAPASIVARLALTAIEGAYIRARAELSTRPLHEAAVWLADTTER